MNTRVVYVLCGQHNQLCSPAICFATYAYVHPIACVVNVDSWKWIFDS